MYFYLITIIITIIVTIFVIPYIKKQTEIKRLENKIEQLEKQIW